MKSFAIFITVLALFLQVSTIVHARSSYPASSHRGLKLDFDVLRSRKAIPTEVKQSSYDVLEMLEWVFNKRPVLYAVRALALVVGVRVGIKGLRCWASCFRFPFSNHEQEWFDARVFSFFWGGTQTVRWCSKDTFCWLFANSHVTTLVHHITSHAHVLTRCLLTFPLCYSEGFLLIQGLLVRGGASTQGNQVASWPGQNLDWNGDVRTNVELNMMGLWVRNSKSYNCI